MTPFGLENPWLLAALWAGLLTAAASAGLLVAVYVVRRRGEAADRREATFIDEWMHLFVQSPLPEDLPPLDDAQAYSFLRLWIHAFETAGTADPEVRKRLRKLGQRVNAGPAAISMLRKPNHRTRIAATLALGYLKEERARLTLEQFALSGDAHLAPTAMLSLLRMDPSQATPVLTNALCGAFQWNGQATTRVLDETGAPLVQTILRQAVRESTAEEVIFLFRNLQRAKHPAANELAERLTKQAARDQQIISSLREGDSPAAAPRHRDLIASYLSENAQRLRLLEALASEADSDHAPELQPLLESPSRWVREQTQQVLPRRAPTLLRGMPPSKKPDLASHAFLY